MKDFIIYNIGFIIGYLICFTNMDGWKGLKEELKKHEKKF